MRNRLPLRTTIALVPLAIACLLLIHPRMPITLAQVGADARPKPTPTPTPTPKTQPNRKATRSTTQTPRFHPIDPQIELVLVPPGTFMMGSPASEPRPYNWPQHQVTVRGFYMGKYEVTQAQYRALMGTNPSHFKSDNHPVEKVSWNDAVEFCRKLSQMTGRIYRLPTEAEWEYACRAGTTTPFAFGSSLSANQANFDDSHPAGGAPKGVNRERTTPVGSFSPNAWGLYDMHGNVYEWCQDWMHKGYDGAPADGSAWESGSDRFRVLRGGSWSRFAAYLGSAERFWNLPDAREADIGFRVVVMAGP